MYLGIDIGGMSIKAGVVDESGKILAKHCIATPLDGCDSFCAALLASIQTAINLAKIQTTDVEAIGIGYPGMVDRENGILISAANIPGKNIPVRKFLSDIFPSATVLVDNDANCAALGEYYQSENPGDFVFVTLGTGVGGGIILNGKLYIGSNGIAGEFGHIVTHHNGKKCACGRSGCWEMYASVTALKKLTAENSSNIKSISPDEEITGKTVFDCARNGDKEALRVRDEWIEEISVGIADIVNIFQPQEIVIGGAISKEGDVLIGPIRDYVEKYCFCSSPFQRPHIVASRIGGDAGIIGAAFLYKNINNA